MAIVIQKFFIPRIRPNGIIPLKNKSFSRHVFMHVKPDMIIIWLNIVYLNKSKKGSEKWL